MPNMKALSLKVKKLSANQKCDRRTDRQTDGQTDDGQSDPQVALCFAGATKTSSDWKATATNPKYGSDLEACGKKCF